MTALNVHDGPDSQPILGADGLQEGPAEAAAKDPRHAEDDDDDTGDQDGGDGEDSPSRASRRGSQPRPPPSRMRRVVLLLLAALALWLAFAVQKHRARKAQPEIIYASRYSKEFKHRPAASPIITETLKDGRIRLRGAMPPPPPPPTPTPTPRKRRTRRKKTKKGTAKQ